MTNPTYENLQWLIWVLTDLTLRKKCVRPLKVLFAKMR